MIGSGADFPKERPCCAKTRAEALEEAAQLAECYESPTGDEMAEDGCHYVSPQEAIAAAIRALVSPPATRELQKSRAATDTKEDGT